MFRNRLKLLVALAVLPGLAGCAFHRERNPHNDVLVFATQTKFGVDISAPVTAATLPAFNLGYNRTEAVWMPLRPNGIAGTAPPDEVDDIVRRLNACTLRIEGIIEDEQQRKNACLAAILPRDKYVSMSSGVDGDIGGNGLEIDTYSVFASFGARGGVSGSEANGGLAQIFATGIAAQRLASNPQVGNALNTAAPKATQAEAEAREAEAVANSLALGFSAEDRNTVETTNAQYEEFRTEMIALFKRTPPDQWTSRFDTFKSNAGVSLTCADSDACVQRFESGTPFYADFFDATKKGKLLNQKTVWASAVGG